MKVEVRVREWEDTYTSAEPHGEVETQEIDQLMGLFTKWGVIEKKNGGEVEASGQFIFDAPKNKLYFELSFGVE